MTNEHAKQLIVNSLFCFLGFVVGVVAHQPEPTPDCVPFQTDYVIDGDTLETQSGTTLRLARIDAPELDQPKAQDAKHYLQYLTSGRTCYKAQEKGYYNRTIAEIQVNVSDMMLYEQLADN